MFADDNGRPSVVEIAPEPSYGLALTLDFPPSKDKSPSVYQNLIDPQSLVYSYAEGSNQLLPNGNSLVGYGIYSVVKEFGPERGNGSVYWSAQFGYVNDKNGGQSYRAFKNEWNATPHTPIDLVVETLSAQDALGECAGDSLLRGYVSWNGATDVATYTLFAGASHDRLAYVGAFDRKGFETAFVIPSGSKYVRVEAQGHHWRPSGTSRVVAVAS